MSVSKLYLTNSRVLHIMEDVLYCACEAGGESRVKELLDNNPTINVNTKTTAGWAALHRICHTNCDVILDLLLTHHHHASTSTSIDVNQKTDLGFTPLAIACARGSTSCVRRLLKDPRVRINDASNTGYTPFFLAARSGYLDVVKWLIASERLDVSDADKTTAIEVAVRYGKTNVVSLLKKFREQPDETRYAVRVELGFHIEMAAEIFAMVIFLCDGLVQVRTSQNLAATHFFTIASRLPFATAEAVA